MKISAFKLMMMGALFCFFGSNSAMASIKSSDQDNSKRLLSSVKSEYKTTFYEYNSDSTLSAISIHRNGKNSSETKFIYSEGKIKEMIWKDFRDGSEVKKLIDYEADLIVKYTMIEEKEVVAMVEYFYNEDKQLVRQIEMLEWNNEANKQKREIEIKNKPGKNKVLVTYNDILKFEIQYDNKLSPLANIKGYKTLYGRECYGITNNIISYKRIPPKGKTSTESTELSFDSTGDYLMETTKMLDNQRLICKEFYSYK